MSRLTPAVDPRLLVGSDTLDDAAVVRIADDRAVVFTADFITPLVDDPGVWGRIAAVNSLSDIYAMGGQPLAALNLVAWPSRLPAEMLLQVLQGGAAAASEAACLIVGGHTVEDPEPKYGLAALGLIRPDAILRNRGARPGDRLYLTKPLGTGILTTAIKAEFADPDQQQAAVRCMTALNRTAAEAAVAAGARAMTDVTGFGLIGHLTEMLGDDGDLGVRLSAAALPWLPGVREQMAMGMVPRGAYRNRDAFAARVQWDTGRQELFEMLVFDPQTSGGLLIALPPDAAATFEARAADHGHNWPCLGQFTATGDIRIGD